MGISFNEIHIPWLKSGFFLVSGCRNVLRRLLRRHFKLAYRSQREVELIRFQVWFRVTTSIFYRRSKSIQLPWQLVTNTIIKLTVSEREPQLDHVRGLFSLAVEYESNVIDESRCNWVFLLTKNRKSSS